MKETFASFGSAEWLRLAFTVLLCIPVIAVGGYLFGLLADVITGADGSRRRKKKS